MYRMPGGYPELRWRDYLLVDGWAYLTDAKGLLRVNDYQVLSQVRAWWVLEEIYREDARLCDALLDAYAMGRCLYERDTLATLKNLLGFSPDPFVAEVNRLARLIVFERKPLKPTPPPEYQVKLFKPAPLSDKSSWVTIECVDDSEPPRPAPDISLEVITASAEVRTARTNQQGIAFVDGIAAGRVTIRLLDLDGSLWHAVEGDAAQPSPEDERFTWHEVKQGECLSRIAHQYGFKYWQDIWKFRLNKALREKRKSPHVLYPGDMLAVPAVPLYEIVRETEQTHRIAVTLRALELKLVLGDHHGRPFRRVPYELRLSRSAATEPIRGTTDGAGQLQVKLPPSTGQVFVTLPEQGLTWPVVISSVPGLPETADAAFDEAGTPREEVVRALQTRLNALGIAAGPVTGMWDEPTQLAVLQLRRGQQREVDDLLCDDDLRALEQFGV